LAIAIAVRFVVGRFGLRSAFANPPLARRPCTSASSLPLWRFGSEPTRRRSAFQHAAIVAGERAPPCSHQIENKSFCCLPNKRALAILNSSERYLTSKKRLHASCSGRGRGCSSRIEMDRSQSVAMNTSRLGPQFDYLANSLAQLLEAARREFERDREAAKVSLATASTMLQAEIDRSSGANGSARGGLAAWQILRVQAYIDTNLHRTIHIRDLSAVARRSPAHFSRKFKLAVGDSPHAYVVRRRLERACHLMMTSSASLSEIALSVGFSDQAHLCRLFRHAFGQSPASWRRERGSPGEVASRSGGHENSP